MAFHTRPLRSSAASTRSYVFSARRLVAPALALESLEVGATQAARAALMPSGWHLGIRRGSFQIC